MIEKLKQYGDNDEQYKSCTFSSDVHPLIGTYTPETGMLVMRIMNNVKHIPVASESDAEKAYHHTAWELMV